ncbi:DNA replication licensing factor MCM7 [Cryomyces antarcticus]|nr:DNA replication licensing factor MCM7 [Cryomyces antarcticus]
MHNTHPEPSSGAGGVVFTPAEVRQWVARARSFRPTVPKPVSDYLVGAYVRMRQQQKRDEGSVKQFTHVSPRTLLGAIRISQALARLRFAEEVVTEDVDEALRLLEASKASLYSEGRNVGDNTPSSKIYNLVRGMAASGAAAVGDGRSGELDLRRVRERVLAKGFTEDQFRDAVDEYALLDVWQTAAEGTRLVFIEAGDADAMDDDF